MPLRDWRSPAAYADLKAVSPHELAWEFLRRNPAYQRDYESARQLGTAEAERALAQRWGLRSPRRSED